MPTIARGNLEEVYVPSDSSVTVTPGAGGYVKAGFAVRQGMTAVPPREIRAATTLSVSGGTTLFLEAINTDATYTSPVSGDGTLRRRPMIGRQLMPQTTFATAAGAGTTISQAASAHQYGPRAFRIDVQSNGSVQTFGAATLSGLDTNAYYALVIDVSEVVMASGSNWGNWFGLSSAPTECSVTLRGGAAGYVAVADYPPQVGRLGYVFRPAISNPLVRFGVGCVSSGTVTAGDKLVITAVGLYRVDGLSSSLPPYARSPIGPVGFDAGPIQRHAGSCILAVGDSWSDGTTDWPGILSETYQREVVVVATSGHTLSQMLTAIQSAVGSQSNLYPPNYNPPGMSWLCGGINDRVGGDRTGPQIISSAQSIIDVLQNRGVRVGLVIQTDCTDSSFYTTARARAWDRWANWVMSSGLPYVDSRTVLQNADGTANATNMLSETGAWTHPSAAGHAALAALVDAEQRRVDLAGAVGAGRWVA